MIMKKINNFNDFAQLYCGTINKSEQINILCDSLLKNDESVNKDEIEKLYDKKCEILQKYFKFNDYYDTYIKIDNITYYCMSNVKF